MYIQFAIALNILIYGWMISHHLYKIQRALEEANEIKKREKE